MYDQSSSARRLREPVRDVDEDLAALDAGELVDRRLHRVEGEREVVLDGLRVAPHAPGGLVRGGRVVDRLDDVAPLGVELRPEGGLLLDLLEDVGEVAPVVRELPPDLQRPVERHDHRLDVALDVVADERLDVAQDAVPVERRDVEVVDEDHDPRLRRRRRRRGGRGRRLGRRGSGGRLLRRQDDAALLDRGEVRQGLLDPVLDHDEVVFLEAGHAVALGVRDDDVQVRHADALVRDERPGPGRGLLRGLGDEARDRHSAGKDGGEDGEDGRRTIRSHHFPDCTARIESAPR